MFYKHWKKISLALTAFFWASCENNTTEPPLYSVPPQYSSSSETPESSAAKPSSSEAVSSSSQSISSSSQSQSSSSDFTLIMPAYGVPQMDCDVVAEHDSTVTCANGTTCTEKTVIYMNPDYVGHPCLEPQKEKDNDSIIQISQVCPDYGSIYYENKTYECNNGYTYDEFLFNKRYNSSSAMAESSSSGEVTCTPGDSTVSYYPPSYSADIAKMSAEERAKRAGVAQIDSLKKTLQTTPQCLENLRQELDMLVALYGAPNIFPKDEVCSDGTTRATKEYQEYLKMKEEWEKNKPALDAECQKIYEDKLNEIKQRIDKCLEGGEQ